MLNLTDVSYSLIAEGEEVDLLKEIDFFIEPGSFVAIVGPSGCGKTTLLKTIAGFNEQSGGQIVWNGRSLMDEEDFDPTEVGYVPQFSIAYDLLTVEESVMSAIRLRVKLRNGQEEADERLESILAQTGLGELRDQRVAVLSGGQKRRLGLAMELASNPQLLLCDEVTSGLDHQSEKEIVELMHSISREGNRIVMNVTHSFGGLELYDSVLVLYRGRLVFHGPPDTLAHYFSVENVDDVYERLRDRPARDWHSSWRKHSEHYSGNEAVVDAAELQREEMQSECAQLPGFLTQLSVLTARKFRLFKRDKGQMILHLAIMLGFPLLVIIFAIDGIGQMPKSPLHTMEGTLMEAIEAERQVIEEQLRIGGLISGLVMIQVILLTLTGANNSAREIASERLVYEKEKFAGLRPASYLLSKVIFLGVVGAGTIDVDGRVC